MHLMHEFGVPKLFRADRNERVQTTILGPRIMLELVLHHFVERHHGSNRGIWVHLMHEFAVPKHFGPIATNASKQIF